jgi:hypothetical protein
MAVADLRIFGNPVPAVKTRTLFFSIENSSSVGTFWKKKTVPRFRKVPL